MPFERLSPRERQVLRALCDGKSVTAIATVRAQVRAVLAKLGAGSQLEAVAEANRCGWYAEPHPTELRLQQA